MTIWIGYARAGREFEVQDEIAARGMTSLCARKIVAKRSGKRRRPDIHVEPFLANYIFIEADTEQWFELSQIKYLASTKTVVPSIEIPRVLRFIDGCTSEYTRQKARAEAGERIDEFSEGDMLEVLSGPLRGQMARFRRIVESEASQFPLVQADIEAMGQTVRASFDPLDIKAAE